MIVHFVTFNLTRYSQRLVPATNVFSFVCNFVCITHQLSINHVFVVFNDPTTIIDSSKPQSYIHFFFTHTLPRTVRVIFFNVVISHKKAIDGYWLFFAFYMSWRLVIEGHARSLLYNHEPTILDSSFLWPMAIVVDYSDGIILWMT